MYRQAILLASFVLVISATAEAAPPRPTSRPTSRPTAINDSPKIPFLAKLVARSFFAALVAGELEALLPLCGRRVNFDGAVVSTRSEIKKQLQQLVDRARHDGLRLSRLVLLDQRDMRRHFGKAPPRIRSVIRPGQIYALGRFARLGAVVVLQRIGRFWRVVGITD